MFIRIKKIKNNKYAYLVKNRWNKKTKKIKQKTIAYLGKIYEPKQEDKNFKNFLDFYNIKNTDSYSKKEFKEIVKDLINFEIKTSELKNKVKINYEKQELKINGKDAVLKINEGYLCSYTIKKLLSFKKLTEEDEKNLGLRLANLIVEAGLSMPKELFVKICEKFFK